MTPLTDRQMAIFQFLCDFLITNGYPPTVRDIMATFKITANGATSHLRALEKKKWISARGNKGRAFQILVPMPVIPVREGDVLKIGAFSFILLE